MQIESKEVKELKHRWEKHLLKKSSIHTLCEEYAQWTLPYLFARNGLTPQEELQIAKDSIGAQAVNHLSNKVVSTLFPPQTTFFRLRIDSETKKMIAEATSATGAGNVEAAKAQVSAAMLQVDQELADAEQAATEYMDMVAYRPQAVYAAMLLIVTGNALMYHPEGKPVQVYSLRDFCVQRDLSGEVIEIMTKEEKAFETFSPKIQEQLKSRNLPGSHKKDYCDETCVTIYTRIVLEDDGKYHAYQSGDYVELDTEGAVWPKALLPWIPLTWKLVRGEDYGRGLVGDYAGAFHAINTLSGSLLNIAAVMGDIKFLVDPASHIDVAEMNNSAPGSYHAGKKDQISVVETNKLNDANFILALIERYEKQIAQAFLLMSQMTRQAERVTAEEIRRDANELETSNGGIYSRLASTWQVQTANVVLDQSGFKGLGDGIIPQIITGMDSLSRAAELDNLRMFFLDLQMLNTVPEDVRAGLKVPGLMKIIGTNRQVDYSSFTKTEQEMAADRQAQQQALAEQEANKAKGQAQVSASKAAMEQPQ